MNWELIVGLIAYVALPYFIYWLGWKALDFSIFIARKDAENRKKN